MSLRLYEEVLVLNPGIKDEARKKLFSEAVQSLQACKGVIHHAETWGLRSLANPHEKKLAQGEYFYRIFSSSKEALAEVRHKLRIHDFVVYFHHEKLDDKRKPSAVLEQFHDIIKESSKREQERALRQQKYKAKTPSRN